MLSIGCKVLLPYKYPRETAPPLYFGREKKSLPSCLFYFLKGFAVLEGKNVLQQVRHCPEMPVPLR